MDENFTSKNRSSVSEISVYQLVNAISDAAFVCDHTGLIIYCSDHVIPFFGISDKARVIGSSFQSYIAYEFIDEAYFLLSNTVNEGSNKKTGKFPVKKGLTETFNASITFATIANDGISGNYILITFREVPVAGPEIGLLHKKDVRLSRLVEILSNTTVQPGDRTSKMVSQIGETLGAITCTYSRLEKEELLPYAAWESPFNKGITPQLFGKQLFDYLIDHKETLTLIRKPLLTEFLKSEPSYNEEYGVKTILGFTIIKNKVVDGILTAVFPFNYTLSNSDKLFIQTISSVIENGSNTENDNITPIEPSFHDLIDRFADPIFILSNEGILLEANKSALKYYGFEREDLIGQTPLQLSAEGKDNSELIRQMLEKTLNGEPQKFEWLVKNKKGEILPSEISLTKSNYKGQETIIAIVRDLTETKKVVNELLRHNHELVESNLSKDKFFSIFAHDLKNPFQGLLGFIDLLYEDLDELSNEQVKEYLSNVRNASYHTYALLENLLEWSRIQSGKMPFTPTVFDIHDEISSVITVLDNNATQKDIKLINEVDSGIMVEADRNMIRSVIQNIVTNSIKFSNSNGRVVIRGRVPIHYSKDKSTTEPGDRQWLEISISDNGIGIPEEILPKLFKLNGQYSSAGTANEPGTGLGLVLCHEMVEKNGGRIWAESIPGQGTTFIFTIMLSN
jgi:two-component system sensor histidine kinase/response regulator